MRRVLACGVATSQAGVDSAFAESRGPTEARLDSYSTLKSNDLTGGCSKRSRADLESCPLPSVAGPFSITPGSQLPILAGREARLCG